MIFSNKLRGGKISKISRSCNLISIQVKGKDEEEIFLHIQSFFRILKNRKILVSSDDIYRCGEKCSAENFVWDTPGNSVFDEVLQTYITQICNVKILQVKQEESNDLIITLEDGWMLQILIDTTISEEKYRIFNQKRNIVIYS